MSRGRKAGRTCPAFMTEGSSLHWSPKAENLAWRASRSFSKKVAESGSKPHLCEPVIVRRAPVEAIMMI